MDCDDGTEEFIESLKYEQNNLGIIMKDEPSVKRCLLLLGMSTAVDCMDWAQPDEAAEICCQSIRDISQRASGIKDRWCSGETLILEDTDDLSADEWNDLFMDSQTLFRNLLESHLDAFGRDTDEKIEMAYRETTYCLTCMAAVACVRSNDMVKSETYVTDTLKRTMRFIEEHCKMVKRSVN